MAGPRVSTRVTASSRRRCPSSRRGSRSSTRRSRDVCSVWVMASAGSRLCWGSSRAVSDAWSRSIIARRPASEFMRLSSLSRGWRISSSSSGTGFLRVAESLSAGSGTGRCDAGQMGESVVCLRFDEDLWFFLAPRNRRPGVHVPDDGTSTIGHLVEALGVPLTEVGSLAAGGQPVAGSYRPVGGEVGPIGPVAPPQRLPLAPPPFLLDGHLGTPARPLRLAPVTSAYSNDADDDE